MGQLTPRIMIVESFGNNIRSLSSHLSAFPLPLELVSAGDAASALAQFQRETINLIIVDSCLRGKTDGFELCRTLRSSCEDRHLSIILILSGYLSLERFKGIAAGADLLLHRPVVKEELLKMIQLLLGWKFEENAHLHLAAVENRGLEGYTR